MLYSLVNGKKQHCFHDDVQQHTCTKFAGKTLLESPRAKLQQCLDSVPVSRVRIQCGWEGGGFSSYPPSPRSSVRMFDLEEQQLEQRMYGRTRSDACLPAGRLCVGTQNPERHDAKRRDEGISPRAGSEV